MRTRIPIAACAAALLTVGCGERPGDGSSFPIDPAHAHVFNLHVTHHALQGDATLAQPSGDFKYALYAVWSGQCGIDIANFDKNDGIVMGQNQAGQQVRLGQRFDLRYSNNEIINANITAIRDRIVRKSDQFNRGCELFYAHELFGGPSHVIDGVALGARAAMVKSAQACTESTCRLVPPHELGHLLNLGHRDTMAVTYKKGYYVMDPSRVNSGANLEGKKSVPGGIIYESPSECYISRRYGLYNQYFVQPRPAGMMP